MDTTWQVGGLPLHPLLVHAVVVLVPLAVLAVALAHFWPSARRRLGVVTPLLAVSMAALVPVTITAGRQLKEVVGPLPRVLEHESYGQALLPWAIALAVVALVQWWWFRRRDRDDAPVGSGGAVGPGGAVGSGGAVAWVLRAVVIVVGVGTMVAVVLAGDSGARAVWEGVIG